MKKVILLSLIAIMGAIAMGAQNNISVAAFRLDPTDITANTRGTSVIDQNGEVCALIKVRTTQTGFSFDVGVLGVTKTEQHTGEIWVYVPHGIKHITIQHQQLGTCEYPISISVDKARTYIMELTTGKVTTVVEESVTEQYVVFDVTPKDALITLDGETLTPVGGTAMKLMRFGTYNYRVERKDYHPEVGKITVSDPVNKHILTVNLKPAFGWIDIKESPSAKGGRVYIDNEPVGTVPMKTQNIASGQHEVKIVRQMYADFVRTVTVRDSQTTEVTPTMDANFTNVTLTTTAKDAEIWVNGQKKGTGSWTGDLAAGDYVFETRAANHRTATTRQTITANQPPQTITLVAPTPITGKLEITTLPAMADIYIDGQKLGQTPMNINDILIGEHKITISKTGYGDINTSVQINEGQTAQVGGTLSESTIVTIQTNNPNANIQIDGVDKGIIKNRYKLGFGTHTIRLTGNDYKEKTVFIEVTPQRTSFQIDMEASRTLVTIQTNNPNANIQIDGVDKGIIKNRYKLDFGTHTIRLTGNDYKEKTVFIEVTPQRTSFQIDMEASCTLVTIQTNNPNANIQIDGVDKGIVQSSYNLDYGTHTILLSCQGYKEYMATIDVAPQKTYFQLNMEALFANKTFTVNGVTFTMVAVKGGTLKIGATPEQDPEYAMPAYKVTLSDYYISQTEVTQALWKAVMDNNTSETKNKNIPVEKNWFKCEDFITQLNLLTGQNFRLPTETEWEYAARGGNKSRHYKYSGSNDIDQVAWYLGNQPHDVATKTPNELGIYDMSGNVMEFCIRDESSRRLPITQGHIVRGGGYNTHPKLNYVASIGWTDYYIGKSGFRLVLSPSTIDIGK